MQNALAIIQFPLAPVQPAVPDSAPTTQDFFASFAAALPELEGDARDVEQPLIASDQAVAWVVPILHVSGVMPAGLRAAPTADRVTGDLTLLPEAAVPEMEHNLEPSPSIDTVSRRVLAEGPSEPGDFKAIRSEADDPAQFVSDGAVADEKTSAKPRPLTDQVAEDSVASGKASADRDLQALSSVTVGLPGITLPENVQAEAPAPHVQERLAPIETPTTASPLGPQIFGLEAPMGGQSAVKLATFDTESPVLDPQTQETSLVGNSLVMGGPVDASPVGHFGATAQPSATKPAPDQADLANLVDTGPAALHGPAAETPILLPDVQASVIAALTPELVLPREAPFPEPRILTSFWERYFTNGSDRLPHPAQQALVSQEAGNRVSGAMALMPLIGAMQDPWENSVLPTAEVSATKRDGDSDGADFGRAAPPTLPSPSPAPMLRLETVPTLTVLPWNGGSADRDDSLDAAQSSFSPLSSLSSPTASPASGGSISGPVMQVAAQLAGVLVQASDKVTELALAPEELGKVRLRMETDAANPDRLTITINVERPETLDLFRRHAGELAEAIRNAGYSGAQIDFGRQGQGNGGDHQHGHSSAGSNLAAEEVTPNQHSSRMMAGATLDLRL